MLDSQQKAIGDLSNLTDNTCITSIRQHTSQWFSDYGFFFLDLPQQPINLQASIADTSQIL